jgi:hypothetical protein
MLDLVVSREDRDFLSLSTKALVDALLVVVVRNGASGAADRKPRLPEPVVVGLEPRPADSFGAG